MLKIFSYAFQVIRDFIAIYKVHCSPQVLDSWKLSHCKTYVYVICRNRFYYSWTAHLNGRGQWRNLFEKKRLTRNENNCIVRTAIISGVGEERQPPSSPPQNEKNQKTQTLIPKMTSPSQRLG